MFSPQYHPVGYPSFNFHSKINDPNSSSYAVGEVFEKERQLRDITSDKPGRGIFESHRDHLRAPNSTVAGDEVDRVFKLRPRPCLMTRDKYPCLRLLHEMVQ